MGTEGEENDKTVDGIILFLVCYEPPEPLLFGLVRMLIQTLKYLIKLSNLSMPGAHSRTRAAVGKMPP
jgi:hypothetical protein